MDFGTYPTGWHIEGDLPNQVAVSTGSTVLGPMVNLVMVISKTYFKINYLRVTYLWVH